MNERIIELADEALQLVADEHTNGDESRLNTDSYHVKDLIQSKFAELIVRECADLFDKNETEYAIPEHRIHNSIMIHFGLY
jgi:hypothetical protein